MQEDEPLFPRPLQRLGERSLVGSDPEPALRVRVSERVGRGTLRHGPGRRALTGRERKQRLLRLPPGAGREP
jgi:hypothetical protein